MANSLFGLEGGLSRISKLPHIQYLDTPTFPQVSELSCISSDNKFTNQKNLIVENNVSVTIH